MTAFDPVPDIGGRERDYQKLPVPTGNRYGCGEFMDIAIVAGILFAAVVLSSSRCRSGGFGVAIAGIVEPHPAECINAIPAAIIEKLQVFSDKPPA